VSELAMNLVLGKQHAVRAAQRRLPSARLAGGAADRRGLGHEALERNLIAAVDAHPIEALRHALLRLFDVMQRHSIHLDLGETHIVQAFGFRVVGVAVDFMVPCEHAALDIEP